MLCSSASPTHRSPSKPVHLPFTLIELLVVVAIIAILASLLLPALATAKEKSTQTACINRLKQLGLGFALYSDDYDNYVAPRAALPGGTSYWKWVLDPYLSAGDAVPTSKPKSELWFCPKHPRPGAKNLWGPARHGYALNKSWWDVPTKRNHIVKPEQKVLLAEKIIPGGGSIISYYYVHVTRQGRFDHQLGMHVLFCDYHVDWFPVTHQAFAGNSGANGGGPYWFASTQ